MVFTLHAINRTYFLILECFKDAIIATTMGGKCLSDVLDDSEDFDFSAIEPSLDGKLHHSTTFFVFVNKHDRKKGDGPIQAGKEHVRSQENHTPDAEAQSFQDFEGTIAKKTRVGVLVDTVAKQMKELRAQDGEQSLDHLNKKATKTRN